LSRILLFCEGENDKIFLHEAIIQNLTIDQLQVQTYSTPNQFNSDLQSNRLRMISILEGGGYPNYIKLAVKLSRQFWNITTLFLIGLIGDSDRGHVFNELKSYLTQFLNTPCKTHAITPQITIDDALQMIQLTLRRGRQITIWTMQIPENLEQNLSKKLKISHREFRSEANPHELINKISHKLNISKEELIRRCVTLVGNEQWFIELVSGLREKILIP